MDRVPETRFSGFGSSTWLNGLHINLNLYEYLSSIQKQKTNETNKGKKDFEKEFWIVQNTINENPIKINRLNSFFGF